MTTVFAAIEYNLLFSVKDKTFRIELYSTRQAAEMAISQWASEEIMLGDAWLWSTENNRWECMKETLNIMEVEEHLVHDVPLKKQESEKFELTYPTYKNPTYLKTASDCLHDNCPTCHGTGYTPYGGPCIHGISCPCRKCSPWYGTGFGTNNITA